MRRATVFLVATLAAASLVVADDKPSWKKIKEISLGGASKFDYLSVDGKRLYVAHPPKVDVIDLEKGERVGEVEGVDGAHGIVIRADLKRGFATAGSKSKLICFDLESLKVTKEITTGKNPDFCLFVNATGEVWTMNGKDGSVTCVDPTTLAVTTSFDVGGKLESAVEDKNGVVWINVEDKGELVTVDAKKHAVLAHYPLDPAKGPTGLALDAKNGVLAIGCEKALAFVDASSGKLISTQTIADECDGVAFDAESGCALASCGEGSLAIVRIKDAKTFELVATVETQKGARTCTLDPATHRLYLASPKKEKGAKGVDVLVLAREGAQ